MELFFCFFTTSARVDRGAVWGGDVDRWILRFLGLEQSVWMSVDVLCSLANEKTRY